MFDFNSFKRNVKDWMKTHPEGSLNELQDFCEECIPPQQYQANEWLVDQTLSWYKHILNQRHQENSLLEEVD